MPNTTPQTDITHVWETHRRRSGRIAYVVRDCVDDLRDLDVGKTALRLANTPNLDGVARASRFGP